MPDTEKTVLTKIYSREKPLFYLEMWDESDRLGWVDFLGHDVEDNLFLYPGPGEKSSVWYEQAELDRMNELLTKKILDPNDTTILRVEERLTKYWEKILPYVSDHKILATIEDFQDYYSDLVHWWSAMNTVFGVPDMPTIPQAIRYKILFFREQSERYTQRMSDLLVEFVERALPTYEYLADVLLAKEVVDLAHHKLTPTQIVHIEKRLEGYGMFNETIYVNAELPRVLLDADITLDRDTDFDDLTEFKGTSASIGVIAGRVRLIHIFADLKDFQDGEVLVTEMTNPDYLPALRRAHAIITDEGGITCHAAIIARELHKPCIIGTKIAMRALKTGDEVEVDANRGIVTIVKRI